MPEVAGLGEIGIDYTEPAATWYDQMERMEKVLTLLEPRHVLVLHCRGMHRVSDDALLNALHLLMAQPTVLREQRIHVHCFTGSGKMVAKWLKVFPNTYFGFTSMVERYRTGRDDDLLGGVRAVEMSRLLLETDSPYFTMGRKHSTPAMIGMAAERVARARGIGWEEAVVTTARNTRRLYLNSEDPAE